MADSQGQATPPSDGGLQWTANPQSQSGSQTAAPPPGSGLQWTENPNSSQPSQSVTPSKPLSGLEQIHRGLEQGVADGFSLKAPEDDPHKLTLGDMIGQTWSNLKTSAIHSFEKLGGHQEDLEISPKTGLFSGPAPTLSLRSGAALIGTPFHMVGSGIDSMATTLENGGKELIGGLKANDRQAAARGFGKMLASLGQVAVGMEGSGVDDMVARAGQVAEKAAPKPGAGLLRATSEKNYLYGKNPGRVFIDEPIKPTLGVENLQTQIENAGRNLDKQVRDTLSHPDVTAQTIRADQIIDSTIQDALKKVANESGLRNRNSVIQALHTLRDDIVHRYDSAGNMVGSIRNLDLAPVEVNEIKKSVGKSTRWDQVPGSVDPEIQAFVNDTRKAIYGKLNDAIESSVEKAQKANPDVSLPSVKSLNGRYANVIEANRLLAKRLAQEESGGVLGLGLRRALAHGEWMTALGLLIHGEPILGSTLLTNRLLRSTPGRIVTAQTLAKTGRGLQSAAGASVPGTVAQAGVLAGASAGSQHLRLANGNFVKVRPRDFDFEAHAQQNPHLVTDGNEAGWTRVQTSDGRTLEVHPEDVGELKKRDPGAQIIGPTNK